MIGSDYKTKPATPTWLTATIMIVALSAAMILVGVIDPLLTWMGL